MINFLKKMFGWKPKTTTTDAEANALAMARIKEMIREEREKRAAAERYGNIGTSMNQWTAKVITPTLPESELAHPGTFHNHNLTATAHIPHGTTVTTEQKKTKTVHYTPSDEPKYCAPVIDTFVSAAIDHTSSYSAPDTGSSFSGGGGDFGGGGASGEY